LGFFLIRLQYRFYQKETSIFCRKAKSVRITSCISKRNQLIDYIINNSETLLAMKGNYMANMQTVKSSNIKEVGYNEITKTLVVRFLQTDKLYAYANVEVTVYKRFLMADSLGKFFGELIKNSYVTTDLEEKDLQSTLGINPVKKPRKKLDYNKALKSAMFISRSFPGAAVFF